MRSMENCMHKTIIPLKIYNAHCSNHSRFVYINSTKHVLNVHIRFMILDFYDGESISRLKSGIQKHPHHSYKVRFKHKIITVSPPNIQNNSLFLLMGTLTMGTTSETDIDRALSMLYQCTDNKSSNQS